MRRVSARALATGVAMLASGLLPGCASITGTDLQLLSLNASDKNGAPVAGAECKLSNDKGTWHAKPPASPTVLRSAEDLLVNCEAAGQAPGTVRAISRANAGMAGNLIFGGVIGMVIDHGRGTAYDYPSMIDVVLGASKVIDRNDEFAASRPDSSAAAPAQLPGSTVAPQAAIAADGPNAPATEALPAVGSRYRYAWTEQQYGRRKQEFDVLVTGVNGWTVMEAFAADGRPPARYQSAAEAPVFSSRRLGESQTLVEFAPYLPSQGEIGSQRISAPTGYATDAMGTPWTISVQMRGLEPVTVPAGTFKAIRVDIQGSRFVNDSSPVATSAAASRFEFSAWYTPELKRYVRSRHQTWNKSRSQIGDEQVELLEFRPN